MKWLDFLEKNSEKFSDKIALIEQRSGVVLTYKELLDQVNKYALVLKEKGVKAHQPFAFLSTNRIEHILFMLAASRLKAIFVPMNFRLSKKELENILENLAPSLFIFDDKNELTINSPSLSLQEINLEVKKVHVPESLSFDEATLDDPILMLYTSGSTGFPKGVLFHGQMLLTNMIETCRNWKLESSDKTLVETPFFHTGGYNVLCLPLMYLGGTSILAEAFRAQNVYKTIKEEKITVYFGVPTMFQMLYEDPEFKTCDFKCIRFFISGGAACSVSLIEAFMKVNVMFKQGFGLTEVGPNCFLLDEEYAIKKQGSIGKPMPHSDVVVVNKENKIVKANEPGELLIRGEHLTLGYFKDPEKFNATLKEINGKKYFCTGDLVQFDDDGFFYVVGRIKDMYISGGENVYPGEVEKIAVTYPNVNDAVVVAVKDERWGEVGHIFLKTDDHIELADLKLFFNDKLSRYKHPHFVTCMKEFPVLANGKVDRKKLQASLV